MPDREPRVRYRRADRVVWRRVRRSVLVDGPEVGPLRLDGAAAAVWLALDAPSSTGDLRRAGGGEPSTGLIEEAMGELLHAGLVEVVA